MRFVLVLILICTPVLADSFTPLCKLPFHDMRSVFQAPSASAS